jgi:ABC-2 type transport system permease protein
LLNSAARSSGGLRLRALVFVVLGGGLWAAIFGATRWFLDQCQRVEIFGDLLIEELTALSLLVVFTILIFSNLVASFSAYYLADDLPYLMSRPVRPYPFYGARFVELLLEASWMVFLFSLPVFISVGAVYQAEGIYYLRLVLVLLPLFVIATAVASGVSLVLTNLLPARRTREVLLVVAALAFVVVFVVFRAVAPERFLDPDQRATIVEVLSTFQAPRMPGMPSEWAQRVLWPTITGDDQSVDFYLACLYATAAGLFFVGAWLFRALHFEGFSKAAEGRPEGSAPERLWRRLTGRRGDARELGRTGIEALARRGGVVSFTREMRRKDFRVFFRDTAQWTQLVLLSALVVIYLLNFKFFKTIGEGGIIGATGLYFTNLSLAGFVVTAISVRFVFPALSLEGRAFWLIRSAPLTTRQVLRAKWIGRCIPIALFGLLLTLASNALIGVEPWLNAAAVILQLPTIVGVVGLGVGLGTLFPKLHTDNAAKIATGFGGFVYMVSGVALNLFAVALSVYPTLLIRRALEHGTAPTPGHLGAAVALGALALSAPLIAGSVVLRLAARRLAR